VTFWIKILGFEQFFFLKLKNRINEISLALFSSFQGGISIGKMAEFLNIFFFLNFETDFEGEQINKHEQQVFANCHVSIFVSLIELEG